MHEPLLESPTTDAVPQDDKHSTVKPPAGWGYVYSIQSPSGHRYIGQTRYHLAKRYSEHCYGQGGCRVLLRAIHRYGQNNMRVVVLAATPLVNLGVLKALMISEYQTLAPTGYNLTTGGPGSPQRKLLTAQHRLERRKRRARERKSHLTEQDRAKRKALWEIRLRKWQHRLEQQKLLAEPKCL